MRARWPHSRDRGRDRPAPADPAARPVVPAWPYLTLAGILALATVPAFLSKGYGPMAFLAGTLVAAPVVIVRFRPMIGWFLSLLTLAALLPIDRMLDSSSHFDSYYWLIIQASIQLPVIYTVALSASRRRCYLATAITLVAECLSQLKSEFSGGEVYQTAAILALATLLIMVLGRFRLHRHTAGVRIAEEEGMRHVLEERTRIARELHDVVAHHMSVIAIQASTAPYRLDHGRPEVDREFQAIGTSAREALQELRQVLDVLRGSAPAAMPGLTDLPKLVESSRLAGVPVRMIMDHPAPEPGPEVGYAAYRIVQEALSNVIRHAAGADTTVRVATQPAGLLIEVINDRPPARVGPPNPSGHGLTGIRERVEAAGGTAWIGPTEWGGFLVRAVLPVDAGRDSARPRATLPASWRDLAGSVPAPPSTERRQFRRAHSP